MEIPRDRALFLIIVACLMSINHAQIITDPPQFGSMQCVLDGNILRVTMHVVKNGSNIIGAEFFNRSMTSQRYHDGCNFTVDPSDSTAFKVDLQIDVSTDNPPTGGSYCGHYYVPNTTPKEYAWNVHSYHEEDKEVGGDSYMTFRCAASLTTEPIVLSYFINVTIDQDLTPNNGVIRMAVQTPTNNLEVTRVPLGGIINLKLEYQPSPFPDNDNPDLRPWGVYCAELYATPDLQSTRKVYLQDNFGCPRTDHGFPTFISNFAHEVGITDKFIAVSGNLQAARFDKTASDPLQVLSGRVYYVCRARICWRKPDERCTLRCPTTTTKRRKRQTSNDEDVEYTVITYVDIVDSNETEKSKDSSWLTFEYILIMAGVGGALLLLVVGLSLYVCVRRRSPDRYYKHRPSTSVTSTPPSWHRSTDNSYKQPRY